MQTDDRDPNAYYQSKLGVAFYDLFSGAAPPAKGDVDFYAECAREFGDRVLELATGTGRVLWALARAGFEAVGIDASDAMLELARAKASSETPGTRSRVRFLQMDMTSFDLDQSFRLAIVPFRAFQHLTLPDQQRQALRCVHRSLKAGGHFVIDVFDPRLEYCAPGAASPNPERRLKDPRSGHTVVRRVLERVNDPVRQLVTETFQIDELDELGATIASEESSWTLRWSTRQEMRYLFELTGFEVVAEYSDFFRAPPAYGKEQLWVLRKI
ncbi:class I SAM-dependent methyltransferase [Candidatus Binatus sp.]|uniref:class I SAM-dependent methyltransferase n=1 Tax=Candidatus Binatus sp. TaxID=2811406 RepID=UPI003C723E50